MGQYRWIPEVRRAEHRANEAERVAERLGELLAQSLIALAPQDLGKAQRIRGEAMTVTRGIMPRVAATLHRIPLTSPRKSDDA
jgi:hypothetical protein